MSPVISKDSNIAKMIRSTYFFTILCIQMTISNLDKRDIDIGIEEYKYISRRLEDPECRHLYAALHFSQYQIPDTIRNTLLLVPKLPCLNLLLLWDIEKKQTYEPVYIFFERRLRQIGLYDLGDWLDEQIFYKQSQSQAKDSIKNSSIVLKQKEATPEWIIFLYVISALVFIIIATYFAYYNCKYRCYNMRKRGQGDIMDLLNYGDDSEQETVYEYVVDKNVRDCKD